MKRANTCSLIRNYQSWRACRCLGIMLKRIGKNPRVIITDGLPSNSYLMNGVKHILCHFHHQQGVTRWLKKHLHEKEKISALKPKMKKVLQSNDKRTVRRRFQKLKESSQELGICPWVEQTEANLPKLLPSVGSVHIPRTTNAIERFSSPSFSSQSATRHLLPFLFAQAFPKLDPRSRRPDIQSIL